MTLMMKGIILSICSYAGDYYLMLPWYTVGMFYIKHQYHSSPEHSKHSRVITTFDFNIFTDMSYREVRFIVNPRGMRGCVCKTAL